MSTNGSAMPHDENGDGPKRKADGNLLRDEKRVKWESKQARMRQIEAIDAERDSWIEENKDLCQRLTIEDVRNVRNNQAPQPLVEHLIPYFDLKVQNQSLNQICRDRFIAEGAETVKLLLQQIGKRRENGLSHVIILSILVKPGTFFGDPVNLLKDFTACNVHLKPKVFLADDTVFSEIAGFPVARGAMACGIPLRVDEHMLLETLTPNVPDLRILALDGIANMANMGSIIRCAAAFGIHAMVLSKDCCDPWYRRSVRVSMGYVSKVPIMRLQRDDMKSVIRKFREKGIVSYAAVIDADLLLENLNKGDVAKSWCCVLGNEANGIKLEVLGECSHRLRIGMKEGVDSLSVSVAAGILLHGLVEKTKR